MLRLTVLFLLLFVTACGASRFGSLSRSYEFSPDTKKGIVFLSTTFEKDDDTSCGPGLSALWFSRTDGTSFGRTNILLDNFLVKSHFEDSRGYFTNLELSEGEYVIDELTYGSYASMVPLNMRFRVSAGKVDYLGQINVTIERDCLSYDISVKDLRDRDAAFFVREMENFDLDSIDYQILEP